jgi:hypothetical protein
MFGFETGSIFYTVIFYSLIGMGVYFAALTVIVSKRLHLLDEINQESDQDTKIQAVAEARKEIASLLAFWTIVCGPIPWALYLQSKLKARLSKNLQV